MVAFIWLTCTVGSDGDEMEELEDLDEGESKSGKWKKHIRGRGRNARGKLGSAPRRGSRDIDPME